MTVVINRPLRGSRISTFYPVKQLPSLASLDSAFQLQEYISLLIRLDIHDVEAITSVPGKSGAAREPKESESGADDEAGELKKTTTAEEGEETKTDDQAKEGEGGEKNADQEKKNTGDVTVDEACWIYEQLRRLAQDLTHPLITMLQQECTRTTCPEMKAGEWLYLCVAHGDVGATEQCCAIDYILHTLDSATALLSSPRAFPSRLRIPESSHRHFTSLARRLGRIFAHAYFHHRESFEQAEAESSLYARFLALTSKFDLVPSEFLVIPPKITLMNEFRERDPREGGGEVQPPRLLAAAIDPRGGAQQQQQQQQYGRAQQQQQQTRPLLSRSQWEQQQAQHERSKNRNPPGLSTSVTATTAAAGAGYSGLDSPRKYGRHRTDTMVHSEAASVVEELARMEQQATNPFIQEPEMASTGTIKIPPATTGAPSSSILSATAGASEQSQQPAKKESEKDDEKSEAQPGAEEGHDIEPITPEEAAQVGTTGEAVEKEKAETEAEKVATIILPADTTAEDATKTDGDVIGRDAVEEQQQQRQQHDEVEEEGKVSEGATSERDIKVRDFVEPKEESTSVAQDVKESESNGQAAAKLRDEQDADGAEPKKGDVEEGEGLKINGETTAEVGVEAEKETDRGSKVGAEEELKEDEGEKPASS